MVVAMIVVEKVRYDEAGRGGEGGEEEVDGRVIEGMGSVALVGGEKAVGGCKRKAREAAVAGVTSGSRLGG